MEFLPYLGLIVLIGFAAWVRAQGVARRSARSK